MLFFSNYQIVITNIIFYFSGEIKTLEQLDREDIDHYELLIEALDQGSPRRSSQTLVKIIVDDVNDEAPKIEVSGGNLGILRFQTNLVYK